MQPVPLHWAGGPSGFPAAAGLPDRPTQDRLAEVASRLSLLHGLSGSPAPSSGRSSPRGAPSGGGGSRSGRASPAVLVRHMQQPEWREIQARNMP